MNRTLVVAFLRQRLSSPLRLVLLAMQFVLPLAGAGLMVTLAPLASVGFWFAFTFAAGGIGQDVSSGTLQLLLARPVTRPSFVASRWLASGLAATALTVLQLAIATLLLILRGHHPDLLDVVRLVLENAAGAFAGAAVVLTFSSLVGGLGDVAIWFAGYVTAGLVGTLAEIKHWPVLGRVGAEIGGVLLPQLGLGWIVHGGAPSWFALASWASTLALALAVAIARVNRRELSYAAD